MKSAAELAQVWSNLNNKEVGAWSIIKDIPNRSYLYNSGDSDMIQDESMITKLRSEEDKMKKSNLMILIILLLTLPVILVLRSVF